MQEIKTEELKQIQIGILDVVHTFCKENNISYWLDCGTLLGAIRHKGYIPWDDDIDIGMLRKDYEKFCKTFNGNYKHFKVLCIENNPDFYLPHAKVIDDRTVLIEEGHVLSANIDIFVYDNAPDNDKATKRMFDKRDFYRKVYKYTRKGKDTFDYNPTVVKRIARFFLVMIPSKYIILLMTKNCKKYLKKETTKVGNFSSFARNTCSKTAFSSFVEGEFEGKKYDIPIGYDMWLRSFYGDYMKLPPVEKRVSHHTFRAYYKTEE